MNTKEIVKTIENLTGLYFEISINDNQTEVASTFNPEKINHEYFNICNELESYFTELYLDSNNLILERILYLLNNGLKLWNRLKKESFNINLNFENKELKNLETKLTDAELLRIAEIKTHYIQNLISRIENLTVTPIVKALPPQPIKTKADILKEQLSQYGFFELEKVKTLSEQSKVSIIEKIAESGLPYAIAMFDYLQFIPYLEKKHFDRKYKLNREVSKWFDSDKEGRAVKGNISSLLKNTTENKDRYTAYKHKENVIKDYELLK